MGERTSLRALALRPATQILGLQEWNGSPGRDPCWKTWSSFADTTNTSRYLSRQLRRLQEGGVRRCNSIRNILLCGFTMEEAEFFAAYGRMAVRRRPDC